MVDDAEKDVLEDAFDGLSPLGDIARDEEVGTGEVLGNDVAFDEDSEVSLADDAPAPEVYDIAELLVTGDESKAFTEGSDVSGDAVAFDLDETEEREDGWTEDGSTGPMDEFDLLAGEDEDEAEDDGGEIGLERDPDLQGADDDDTELAPLDPAVEEVLAGDLDIGGDDALPSRVDDPES
jgi:hypothetical protein